MITPSTINKHFYRLRNTPETIACLQELVAKYGKPTSRPAQYLSDVRKVLPLDHTIFFKNAILTNPYNHTMDKFRDMNNKFTSSGILRIKKLDCNLYTGKSSSYIITVDKLLLSIPVGVTLDDKTYFKLLSKAYNCYGISDKIRAALIERYNKLR